MLKARLHERKRLRTLMSAARSCAFLRDRQPCVQVVLPKEPDLERESISWFARMWPRTQLPDWPTHRPINAVQRPGEVIFVPAGALCKLPISVSIFAGTEAGS